MLLAKRSKIKPAARFAQLMLLILFSLYSNIALSTPSYRITGIGGDALKNISERLDELAKQKTRPLIHMPQEELKKHVKNAVEAYGYFRSKISIYKKRGSILIRILPGPQLRITTLKVRLVGEGRTNPDLQNTIRSLPVKKGDPLITTNYKEAKEAIINTAEHEGFMRGSFSTAKILIDLKKYTADIILIFNTGPQYYIGRIDFDSRFLSSKFLYRYVPFKYGEPYSTEDIIELNKRLSNSGYFSSVVVNPEFKNNRYAPIKIHTQPVPRYSYSLGAGYGTDTGPRGRASLQVVPVNARGHKFTAIAQGSVKENALQAQYLIPGANPVTDQYSLAAAVGHIDYDSGNSNTVLFSASHFHNLNHYQRILSLNGLYERYSYTGLPRNEQFTLFPKATFTFSKRSDPLFSPSGYNVSFNALGATKALASKYNLAQASVDARAALTIDPIRTRFYLHGIQGFTAINDINNLPLSLALFLGGNDNLKAYSINSIGPGRIISFASLEIQKETVDKWYLIGFYDAGDVYDPRLKSFKYDIGGGLMWVSPVGPIKIGIAQAINNRFNRIANRNPKLVINMGPDLQ